MSSEKVNEEQVSNLLAILRTDAIVDTKVNSINQLKSIIKQNNLPDVCILPIFEATRSAMTSQQAAIVSAGITTLGHLLSRLSRQEPKYIAKEAGRTLPPVIEKMGDAKEKYRNLAAQCLTSIWNKAPQEVERVVKNTGLVGKNSRMKESCICWIVQMHQENAMPFKNYVSALVNLLEDADGTIRDAARNAVISLFQNASNAAKSDLKKQLKIFNVRPTISSTIIGQLGPVGPLEACESTTSEVPLKSILANSVSSVSSITKTVAQTPEAKIEHVEPTYVNTQKELEAIFQDMLPFFEGKESEQNWLKREQSCTLLRRLNAGNAPTDYHDAYLMGIKKLLDGILKAVNSLRTSLSKEGCCVIQEVIKTTGTGMDPMVEILLQNLIKLCGGTKKISSQQGNITIDIIVSKVSYNIRILQHIWAACQDKNVQPRTYATGWLKTLLKKEAYHKNHIEHTGGLDLVEKCIKKGLADANPGVRENMRSTYWVFASMWPAKAEGIMASLDATHQKLLENAPDNPNTPKKANLVSARPGLGFSKSTTIPPKPSLKDTMLAQKKAALAHRNLPVRPGSAMSSFSPVRNNSLNGADVPPGRVRLDSSTSHGGLSVAPMRPTKLRSSVRSDLTTRPATACPYSVRRPGHAPSNSESSPSQFMALKDQKAPVSSTITPKRLPPRPSTSHSLHVSPAIHQTTPKKKTPSKIVRSPQVDLVRPKSSLGQDQPLSSPLIKRNEDLTMIVPTLNKMLNKSQQGAEKNLFLAELTEDKLQVASCEELKISTDILPDSINQVSNLPEKAISAPDEVHNTHCETTPDLESLQSTQVQLSQDLTQDSKVDPPLLDSGIKKVFSKSLDVHGLRKLQGIIRESNTTWTENKFGILLSGLFDYLEAPLTSIPSEKRQDIKTQLLTTIKLMFKKDREAFYPYVIRGLESLLNIRKAYDSRAHIVSGLELFSSELILISEASPTASALGAHLSGQEMSLEGYRSLSMGLHMLKELLNVKTNFVPNEKQLVDISELAAKCLNSSDSGVRMDAVQLCVAIHAKVGGEIFWNILDGMRDDPKSLITYYIVKQQKEFAASAAIAA